MAKRGNWVFNPNSGGKPISELVQRRTDARLRSYAEKHYAGRYSRLEIRFRSQFCYVGAYTEPAEPGPNWPPANWPETCEEHMERLRNTPIRLCRLRYRGDEDHWGSPSLPAAARSTNSRSFPQANSSVHRKTLSKYQRLCTCSEWSSVERDVEMSTRLQLAQIPSSTCSRSGQPGGDHGRSKSFIHRARNPEPTMT